MHSHILHDRLCFVLGSPADLYLEEFKLQFQPFLTAAQNVVLKSGYVIICVVTAIFLLHVFGAVIFQYLKTRHKFNMRHICLSNNAPEALLSKDIGDYSRDSFDPDQPDYRGYATHVKLSPKKPLTQAETLLVDFRYSETKV